MPLASQNSAPLQADVLILGAGLAGLRAGIAALEERPGHTGRGVLNVVCCALGRGPAGSSFANRNNALGMQVPTDNDEQQRFVRRALEAAAPGFADPELLRIMAAQALPRFQELLDWGLPFRGVESGLQAALDARVGGCFHQAPSTAAVFAPLARAHAALSRRFLELGGRIMEGACVLDLARCGDSGGIQGVLARLPGESEPCLLPARSIVLALGGPASLFGRNVCGPAVSGWALALLQRAGAAIRNAGLLQFMWHSLAPQRFFPLPQLAAEGWQFLQPETGAILELPQELRSLAPQRGSHCPLGHGLEDAALDRFLLQLRDHRGVVRLRSSSAPPSSAGSWQEIVLMAHAGNGGAVIDSHGRASVPGLYACGECATGMHGANRIGGGMVLATQVFGARAGASAAREALERSAPLSLSPCGGARPEQTAPAPQNPELQSWLGRALSRCCAGDAAAPDTAALSGLLEELDERLLQYQHPAQHLPLHPEDRLRLETARIIAAQLLQLTAGEDAPT